MRRLPRASVDSHRCRFALEKRGRAGTLVSGNRDRSLADSSRTVTVRFTADGWQDKDLRAVAPSRSQLVRLHWRVCLGPVGRSDTRTSTGECSRPTHWRTFPWVASILLCWCGCQKQPTGPAGKPASASAPIVIDSVPQGAEVFVLPTVGGEADGDGARRVGKTPVTISADECPSRRFRVQIDIDDYLRKLEAGVPALQKWVAQTRADRELGFGGQGGLFDFGIVEEESLQVSLSNKLLADGPVFSLEPDQDRHCVLFVPRGHPVTVLLPLLPDSGVFPDPGDQVEKMLADEHRLSPQRAQSLADVLERCGTAYWTELASQDVEQITTVSWQGTPAETLVVNSRLRHRLRVRPQWLFLGEEWTHDAFLKMRYNGSRQSWDRQSDSNEKATPEVIYIDSVPAGASVYLLPRSPDAQFVPIGTTPMVVDPQDAPDLQFVLMMNVRDYLERIRSRIPTMSQWAEQMLAAERRGELDSVRLVDFEDRRGLQQHDAAGRLVAVGAVCELAFPSQNRICFLFLPPGKAGDLWRQTWPPPTAHSVPTDRWEGTLGAKHPLPADLIRSAAEALSRCGHARLVRPDPFRTDIEWVFSYTAQGPGMQSVVCRIHERLKLREP